MKNVGDMVHEEFMTCTTGTTLTFAMGTSRAVAFVAKKHKLPISLVMKLIRWAR